MGIPAYFRVITQQYKGIIHQTKPVNCDHYFVDFNGIVHQSAQRILSVKKDTKNTIHEQCNQDVIESSIMSETCSYLNKCINVAGPKKMVHTCADGVAPIAKMNQQRKRRYLSVLRNKIVAQHQSGTNATKHLTWDTNAISPGTRFMSHLDVYMRKHVRENPQKIMHFISGADECGEGEHKIFSRMGMLSDDETAFIYGLDADLIMLSLMSHNKHIYLMREAQHVISKSKSTSTTKNVGNNGNSSDDPNFVYLDIHALRVALLQELLNVHRWSINEKNITDPYSDDARDVIESYVTICFVLGNDFLPHTSTLSLKKNGHNTLLAAARNAWEVCGHGAVISGKIQAKFLSILLQVLCKNEDAEMLAINEEYLNKKAYYNPDSDEPEALQCYALQPNNKDRLAQMIYNTSSTSTSTLRGSRSSSTLPSSPSYTSPTAQSQVRQSAWRSIYYKVLFNCKLHDTQTITTAS